MEKILCVNPRNLRVSSGTAAVHTALQSIQAGLHKIQPMLSLQRVKLLHHPPTHYEPI
jgi:hypothetical protein